MAKSQYWWIGLIGVLVFIFIYLALIWSPPEVNLHNLVRILYFHVASAWISILAFCITGIAAITYLVTRLRIADSVSVSSAEIGVVYTTITLITGSLWAKPMWNTWWTWDPRLTTTLILWFLYVAYLLLRGTINGVERRARVSAIFAIIALIDVPIVHYSVQWWRGIHPAVVTDTGINMPGSMAFTLVYGFLAFLALYILFMVCRCRYEMQQVRLATLRESARILRSELGRNSIV